MLNRLLPNRFTRIIAVILYDLVAVTISWVGAFLIRFNFEWLPKYADTMLWGLLPLMVVQVIALLWTKLYRGSWQFSAMSDLLKIGQVSGAGLLAILVIETLTPSLLIIPRSVVVLYPIFLAVFMALGRYAIPILRETKNQRIASKFGRPVIVIGAGEGGALLLKSLRTDKAWKVVGVLDDDLKKQKSFLLGVPVIGTISDLPSLLRKHSCKHVIKAIPSANRRLIMKISRLTAEGGASLMTVPGISQLMRGDVKINSLRPVNVDDLLGREAVQPIPSMMEKNTNNKIVIVTGAGGSIGSELCRQVMHQLPKKLILLDVSEYALYSIHQELLACLKMSLHDLDLVPVLGNITEEDKMFNLMNEHQVDTVYHAAAYKHVYLSEVNANAVINNNVNGTFKLAMAAVKASVVDFVMISTDKAVNPYGVMGESKRLAELVLQKISAKHELFEIKNSTCFSMVRFGNVLGSSGSVVPIFKKQIAEGGPITVTDENVTRYFMTIPEAAQLVIQSGAMAKGGEVFVLDMGEPVNIYELAQRMIELSGLTFKNQHTRKGDIEIKITGLQQGEKLHEELWLSDSHEPTPHERIKLEKTQLAPSDKSLIDERQALFSKRMKQVLC